VPHDRLALTERMLAATELERAIIRGDVAPSPAGDALIQTVAGHLRALLRDLVCGHLDRDLVGLADDLLLGPEPLAEESLADEADDEDDEDDKDDEQVDDWFADPPASITAPAAVRAVEPPAPIGRRIPRWPTPAPARQRIVRAPDLEPSGDDEHYTRPF